MTQRSRKRWKEMSEELKGNIEEMEDLEAPNQTLVVKEHISNDELQEAWNKLIKDLKDISGKKSTNGIKRMVEVDVKAFRSACKRKFSNNDADTKAAEFYSVWQEYLKDPSWRPYKIVSVAAKSRLRLSPRLRPQELSMLTLCNHHMIIAQMIFI